MKRRAFMTTLAAVPLITYGTPGLLWGRRAWPLTLPLRPIVAHDGVFEMFIEIAWKGTFNRDNDECPIYAGLDPREMLNNKLVGVAYYVSGEHHYGPVPLSRVFGGGPGILPQKFHVYTPNMRSARISIQNVCATSDGQGMTAIRFGERQEYLT